MNYSHCGLLIPEVTYTVKFSYSEYLILYALAFHEGTCDLGNVKLGKRVEGMNE